jgi:hypothetical protein
MNKLLSVVLLSAVFLAGCINQPKITTGADGKSVTNFVKVADVKKISDIAGRAARTGSHYLIAKDPSSRPAFVIANENLKQLIGSQNYDPVAFSDALQGLHIKDLKGADGILLIEGTVSIVETAIDAATPLTRGELVAATLLKVQAGIQRSLDDTEPPKPRSYYMRSFMSRMHAYAPDGMPWRTERIIAWQAF